jgi:gallate decarboxylase subunit D
MEWDSGEIVDLKLTRGEGRTRVCLDAQYLGPDMVVYLFNEGAHIGAVAIGEYAAEYDRVSVSILTRVGHKDDIIAQRAAHAISHFTHRPVCVVAGVHLDNIDGAEIEQLVDNSAKIVEDLKQKLAARS